MSERINNLFSKISPRYDIFNHLFSMGIDMEWRRDAAKEAMLQQDRYVLLDAATGTGDLAIAVNKAAKARGKSIEIIGIDINHDMLRLAKKKACRIGDIRFEEGDALRLQYPDRSFEAVTTGFSLRNFDDLEVFVREVRRILKKGGRFIFLDMAKPDRGYQAAFFNFYSRFIRSIGALVDRGAYSWLVFSINNFDKKKVVELANKYGFNNVKIRSLRTGIAFIVTGEKA